MSGELTPAALMLKADRARSSARVLLDLGDVTEYLTAPITPCLMQRVPL